MATHPGVHRLRTNLTDRDGAALRRTRITPTDIEAVPRSLKSEPGLRPVHHHKPIRAEGHLSVTVIAHQPVRVIRTRLRAAGHREGWTALRRIPEGRRRVTAVLRRDSGRTPHVRKATRPEAPDPAGADPRKVQALLRHGRGITADDPGGRCLLARGLDPADARAVVGGTRAVLPALLAAARGGAEAVRVVFLTAGDAKSPVGKRTRGVLGMRAVWIPAIRIPRHVVLTEGSRIPSRSCASRVPPSVRSRRWRPASRRRAWRGWPSRPKRSR